MTNKYFDRFIMLIIALNSLLLGMSDYSHVNSHGELVEQGSWRNRLIRRSELVFTLIFSLECALKIVGMGFYGQKGYLKDRWNWLDFLVVVTGSEPPLSCLLVSAHLPLPSDGSLSSLPFLMSLSFGRFVCCVP
jgi:hypothetical protein